MSSTLPTPQPNSSEDFKELIEAMHGDKVARIEYRDTGSRTSITFHMEDAARLTITGESLNVSSLPSVIPPPRVPEPPKAVIETEVQIELAPPVKAGAAVSPSRSCAVCANEIKEGQAYDMVWVHGENLKVCQACPLPEAQVPDNVRWNPYYQRYVLR